MTVENELETALWIRSFKYTGIEEDIVLNVSAANLMLDWQPVEQPEKWIGVGFDLLAGRRH